MQGPLSQNVKFWPVNQGFSDIFRAQKISFFWPFLGQKTDKILTFSGFDINFIKNIKI